MLLWITYHSSEISFMVQLEFGCFCFGGSQAVDSSHVANAVFGGKFICSLICSRPDINSYSLTPERDNRKQCSSDSRRMWIQPLYELNKPAVGSQANVHCNAMKFDRNKAYKTFLSCPFFK